MHWSFSCVIAGRCSTVHAAGAPIDSKLNGPSGLAVDSQGDIYVINDGMSVGPQSVTVYRRSNPVPVSVLELSQPVGIAAARNGNLYVSDSDRNIAIFRTSGDGTLVAAGKLDNQVRDAPNGGSYIGTPDTRLSDPGAVSLDRDDNIFVLDRNYVDRDDISIRKYAAGSTGHVAPLSLIRGPKSELHRTTAIALDSHGNIYAANVSPDSITEYAAGSNGDVAPIATIAGPQTALHSPSGIAIDSGGRIYVSNFATSTITEYARGSFGDAAPVATIGGPKTEMFTPAGLTLDPAGSNLYVANWADPSVTVYSRSSGNLAPLWSIPPPSYPTSGPEAEQCRKTSQALPWEASSTLAPNGTFKLTRQEMCVLRIGSQAAALPDGKVLITGGFSENQTTNSAEIYDPSNDSFRRTGSMTLPRGGQGTAITVRNGTSITLRNGKVLLLGGLWENADAIAEVYDPRTGAFVRTGRMNVARDSFAACLLEDGRVLVTGGLPKGIPAPPRISVNYSTAPLASAELYDPATGSFTATGNMLFPRAGHAAVRMRDGKVLIVEGISSWNTSPDEFLTVAELYDPVTGTFSATGTAHVQRRLPMVVLLNDGKALLTGMEIVKAGAFPNPSLEIYDPSTGTFGSPIALPDVVATATVLKDGKVLLTGARSSAPAQLFDPSTGKLTPTAATLSPCPGDATLLETGDVLFTGGEECESRQSAALRYTQALKEGRSKGRDMDMAVGTPISMPVDAELFHEIRP
jgi:sugar lactone lactonase YvrE